MKPRNPAASPATSQYRTPGLPSSESDSPMADPPQSELLAHLPAGRRRPADRPLYPTAPAGGEAMPPGIPGGQVSPSRRWRALVRWGFR